MNIANITEQVNATINVTTKVERKAYAAALLSQLGNPSTQDGHFIVKIIVLPNRETVLELPEDYADTPTAGVTLGLIVGAPEVRHVYEEVLVGKVIQISKFGHIPVYDSPGFYIVRRVDVQCYWE